ncbi:hypothetical protein SCLCIDRAFT_1207200 [Scleroderma citrinum Foug A]|uniref:Uncharacterized protein n=1 Tax=Scleroderma citrinum Foug A TaxID=1036808 RepID=A0A0C3EB20_9AGAM|nr:hypothetical protein SCLCIDRAFT_1207200 [Scleroderma citrinum Foug A]
MDAKSTPLRAADDLPPHCETGPSFGNTYGSDNVHTTPEYSPLSWSPPRRKALHLG